MNKRNIRVIKKLEEILGDKELSFGEIMGQLLVLEDDRIGNRWHLSYTPNQISNFLKRKQFEKVKFDASVNQSIWRNKR